MQVANTAPTTRSRRSTARRGAARAEGALVAALRARDPSVARALWERFAPMVFRVLGRTLGPRVALEDPVQEVFLRVFRRGRSLRPHSDLGLFVLRATIHVAHLCLRLGRSRWQRWIPRWRPSHPPGAHDLRRSASLPEPEPLSRFYRALDRLNARDRIAFVLRFVEGLELRDIVAVVGGSIEWLEPRLAWNYAKVTRVLERDPPAGPRPRTRRA